MLLGSLGGGFGFFLIINYDFPFVECVGWLLTVLSAFYTGHDWHRRQVDQLLKRFKRSENAQPDHRP